MKPVGHLMISTGGATIVYQTTGSWPDAAAFFAVGFLLDVDHIVDYAAHWGVKRGTLNLLKWRMLGGTPRVFIPLHGYEYLVAMVGLALLSASTLLWCAALAYIIHLALDELFNRPRNFQYSLAHRAWHGFRADERDPSPWPALEPQRVRLTPPALAEREAGQEI